jgi:EAL domain-containing protein (putative c-di-GMP-specific phosphodiesterase class I)
VAEYVECEEVLQVLRAIGVDYVQGDHLSPPAEVPQPVRVAEVPAVAPERPELPLDTLH